MTEERETSALCPPHLANIPVSATYAAELADLHVTSIWRACVARRLRGLRVPAGGAKTHWLIRVGDLVGYTGRGLSEEQKRQLEAMVADAGWS